MICYRPEHLLVVAMKFSRRRARPAIADAKEIVPALASAVTEGLVCRHILRQAFHNRAAASVSRNARRLRGGCQLFDPEPHPPVVRAFLETLVCSPRMLCSRWFAILNLAGLGSSVAGGVILTYSLTVKPSHYRLVKTREGTVAICLDGKLVQAGFGGPLVATDDPCPDMETTGPVLQVVANRERLKMGLPVIMVGFALQLPAAIFAVFQ